MEGWGVRQAHCHPSLGWGFREGEAFATVYILGARMVMWVVKLGAGLAVRISASVADASVWQEDNEIEIHVAGVRCRAEAWAV